MPDSEFVKVIRSQFAEDSVLDVCHEDKTHSYKLLRELGNGNFGITYMAQDLENRDTVALKVEPEQYGKASIAVFENIQSLLERSPYFPEFRFHGIVINVRNQGRSSKPQIIYQHQISLPKELQGVPPEILMRLNPTVLRSLLQQSTQQTTEQFACTVMDFVKGISLDQKHFSLYESTFYIWQAVKAVAELHAHGIIHGDIKPENLMIDLGGKMKVLDFTTAYLENSSSGKGSAHATSTFSPWAHFVEAKPSRYSDIYGLGATLYFLATGTDPEIREYVSTNTGGAVYCRYYAKLSSVSQPWRKILTAVFYDNVKLLQSRNIVQTNPNAPFIAQLSANPKDFEAVQPIRTAEEFIEALAPVIKEYEPQRRREWNKQRKEQELKQKAEAEKRWQLVVNSVTSQQVDHIIQEETQIRETTENAFREEWDSESKHRLGIESELGYPGEKEKEIDREAEEKKRRSDWEKSLAQWRANARVQLLEKLVETWKKSHEQEWNLEIERQIEWDKPRWELGAQWKKRFENARQEQKKLRLEAEKREYWNREIKTFEHKIAEYGEELDQERGRRRQSIRNLSDLRKQEQRNRSGLLQSSAPTAEFAAWEKKETQALDTLSKWYPAQLAIVQDLRRFKDLLAREEETRIASRTFADRFTDWALTVGIKLTKFVEVSTERAKSVLMVLAVLAVVGLCGYVMWRASKVPTLDIANNYAMQADTLLQAGLDFEKQGQAEVAKQKYKAALDIYLKAEQVYEDYFRLYPSQKSDTIATAHFNASVCGWNSYLVLNTLDDATLPKPVEQLVFAEKHLKIYNSFSPSKETEEKLLKYNIYILLLSDTADYMQSLKSLEEIMNRIQSLGLSLTSEDQSALIDLAQAICAKDMPDIQKTRCDSLLEQLR
jgi:serine/threonine protein kinase